MNQASQTLRDFAFGLPGAYEDHPWGESVAKVNKKVFVFFGAGQNSELAMTIKLPTSQEEALRFPFCSPSGYNLGKSGWITVRFSLDDGDPPLDLFLAWIEESYRTIAPKNLIVEWDAR